MKITPELAEITNKIVAPFCDVNKPIILFVADLMKTMGWKPERWTEQTEVGELTHWNFYFTRSPILLLHVGNGNRHVTVTLEGYNYAYQVKLVTDAMADVGLFE